jgi:large subunit ribosomal protein L25
MVITLKATARDAGKNLTSIRKEGLVPAVVYGAGQTNTPIAVPMNDFVKAYKEAGESGTLSLELPNGKATVLIHALDLDPVKNTPMHVDFLAIDVTKPIEVAVALEFVGVSPAVKGSLGSLVKVTHEVEVRGLTKDIPHTIEVDISVLDVVDSHISVSDLKVPAGVEILANPTDIIASIATVKEEVDEAPTAIDFDAIEVEKKGKKEDEAASEE